MCVHVDVGKVFPSKVMAFSAALLWSSFLVMQGLVLLTYEWIGSRGQILGLRLSQTFRSAFSRCISFTMCPNLFLYRLFSRLIFSAWARTLAFNEILVSSLTPTTFVVSIWGSVLSPSFVLVFPFQVETVDCALMIRLRLDDKTPVFQPPSASRELLLLSSKSQRKL